MGSAPEFAATPEAWQRAARVRLAVFDVDGTLTDGRLILGPQGSELKVFHSRDGQGLVMLQRWGVRAGVITGRSSPVVAERMRALGIDLVVQGCADKAAALATLIAGHGIDPDQAAFLGDDLPDLPALLRVGFAAAVADAHPLVLRHAHWHSRLPGGAGAAREFCDLLLAAQGRLDAAHAEYLG